MQQTKLELPTIESENVADTQLIDWPKSLAEQAQRVQKIIEQSLHPYSSSLMNKQFKNTNKFANTARDNIIVDLLEH